MLYSICCYSWTVCVFVVPTRGTAAIVDCESSVDKENFPGNLSLKYNPVINSQLSYIVCSYVEECFSSWSWVVRGEGSLVSQTFGTLRH